MGDNSRYWLSEHEREILHSLISLDLRSTLQIAADAGVDKAVMLSAISGNRAMSEHMLQVLMHTLHLSADWKLDRSKLHLFRVNADIKPLRKLLSTAESDLTLQYVVEPGDDQIDLDLDPRSGLYFILGYGNIIVKRDHLKRNRGTFYFEGTTLPLTPGIFRRMKWRHDDFGAKVVLPKEQRAIIDQWFADKGEGASVDAFWELLEDSRKMPVTWPEVRRLAESKGLHVIDVFNLIKNL